MDHATGPARFGIAKPAGGSIRNGVCHPAKCSIAGRSRNRRATGRWKRMSNDALNDRHRGEFSSPDDIRSRGQILRDRLRRRRTHRSDNVHGGGRTALKAVRGDDTRITNSLRHHIAIGRVVHHNVADDRFSTAGVRITLARFTPMSSIAARTAFEEARFIAREPEPRIRTMAACHLDRLLEEIVAAKRRFHLQRMRPYGSCYRPSCHEGFGCTARCTRMAWTTYHRRCHD